MLKEKVSADLASALKSRDEFRLGVLRMLSAAIHNREIEERTRRGGGEVSLDDEGVLAVIRGELKKRKDAVEAYQSGGRVEAAEREQAEADFLSGFLPAELPDEAIEKIIREGMSTLGISSEKEFGKLMGWVMARLKGQAGGDRVSALIKRELERR